MNEEQVMSKVVEIVRPFVKNMDAMATITAKTSILDELKVNSARLVDIVLAFEDEFDIEVEDEAADRVATIGDATELVLAKID
ncbi:MAG: acyl carrier protein [Gemmatimonadetes bacterium]|nr:acyl carrier protein [Gemmatimonadota bacterium]